MNGDDRESPSAVGRSGIATVAWVLIGGLCLFAVENLWVDGWVRAKTHRLLPSLVPEGLGGAWIVVCLAMAVGLILIAVCLVLLWRDTRISALQRGISLAGLLATILMCGTWAWSTSGMSATAPNGHSVTLHWNASSTPGAQYNIYRRTPTSSYERLNVRPQSELTYTDTRVASGVTYIYMTRSVVAGGKESANSNEISVAIP